MLLAAPVAHRHLFGAEKLGLNGGIHRRHAAADDDDAAADRNISLRFRLTEVGDELHSIDHAEFVRAFDGERIDATETDTKENGIVLGLKVCQREVPAQHLAVQHIDATDGEDVIRFLLGDIVRRLVGGDAIFVEAAGLFAMVIDRHVEAVDGEAVCRRKTRRPRADDADRFPLDAGRV